MGKKSHGVLRRVRQEGFSMNIDRLGFISGEGTRWHASPFFDERSPGCVPELIVIHNISLPARQFGTGCVQGLFDGTLDCSLHPTFDSLKGLEVSTHFFIDRSGGVTQFVNTDKRAWHAGVSSFLGRTRCNDFSIGIEVEGSDYDAFEPVQYEVLARLIAAIATRYDSVKAVTGHSDIAPGRKTDPGPFFDWNRLMSALPNTVQCHHQK